MLYSIFDASTRNSVLTPCQTWWIQMWSWWSFYLTWQFVVKAHLWSSVNWSWEAVISIIMLVFWPPAVWEPQHLSGILTEARRARGGRLIPEEWGYTALATCSQWPHKLTVMPALPGALVRLPVLQLSKTVLNHFLEFFWTELKAPLTTIFWLILLPE